MHERELYNQVEFQQALLHAISKNVFDFIAVVRAHDRRIIFVNEMGARLFGYAHSHELINQFAPSLRNEVLNADDLHAVDKEIYSKGLFSGETEYITKEGKLFWGRVQQTRFFVGGIEYRLLQIEKIDRAKAAEESLLKEKQRFGALMDYASIGVLIINEQLSIVLMNSCTLRLSGYSKEELSGQKISKLLPSRFRHRYNLHLSYYFKNTRSEPMESGMDLYALRKDGTEFPVEVSMGNFNTDKERFAILFVNDITIRKRGEKEIRKLNSELEKKVKERTDELDSAIIKLKRQVKETEKAKEELVRVMQFQKAVLDSSGAMIIATDPNGTINLFNHAAEDLLGYQADEVIGKCDPGCFHDREETVRRAAKYSNELSREVPPGFEVYVARSKNNQPNKNEWIYVKKDGTKFPVSLSITAFRNKQEQITGFLGVAVDISETKKTEQELKKALERERELSEMKSKFVSIASHEFRTPLSTVLSSTYLLQKYIHTEDQPKREKHIERIISSVNQLTDILNDLLNVGKIEEGKIFPKFSYFNICDHIRKNIDDIKVNQKKGQQIIFRHQGETMVRLDPSLLTHIVTNLLSNSIKFSPAGSAIRIETEIKGCLFTLRITDQGIGIPKEEQIHLFELFFRSENANGIQGTGLGLHIVKKYTEIMNGKIQCNSTLGEGTEFLINIEMTGM